MKFNIDIVSDTVCPWCYVGKKKLEKGIELFNAKYPDNKDTFATNWAPSTSILKPQELELISVNITNPNSVTRKQI